MTQIKLRRDTSTNFTSKNPILGNGEPAYETDTKKLKIGDGTTAYTQLEYFSSGGGGSANIGAALPLKIVNGVISLEVDGQTIQIVDGKLHANLDELGNEVNDLSGRVTAAEADLANKQDKSTAVTTDTDQTISGQKEFNRAILFLGNGDLIRGQQSSSYRNGAGLSMGANTTSTDGGVFAPQWKIYSTTGNVDRTETIITTYNQSKLNSSNFNAANKLVRLGSDGKLPAVDGSNLTNLPVSGVEICDIGMSLYVDETKGVRRYLNGQIVDRNKNTEAFFTRLQEITTLHPSLLDTEENWQAAKTLSPFGQVGKFVFNYSGENIVSVRLPRVVNVQGLFDLQNLGMTVQAGLPNMSLYTPASNSKYGSEPGVIYNVNSVNGDRNNIITTASSGTNKLYIKDDNNIVGNSDTVQPEAIQYPYFIQIATGSETENNIINEIELNNPYSLFDSKYSDHELNNLSWLKSEGQWNAKAVYTDAYDKLLKVYNGTETVEGLSVKLSTETYTDYDFVLNTADETFRLPLKTKLASGKAVVGNGMTLGLTDGIHNSGLEVGVKDAYLYAHQISYGKPTGSAPGAGNYLTNLTNGVTTDPTKSGIETSDSGLYLYFYVGETVQNANLIDAGRIGEKLATKTDMQQAAKASMPSSKYIDLTLGASGTEYTAPANGYFNLSKNGNTNQYIYITVGHLQQISRNTANGAEATIFTPIRKGDKCKISYTATGSTNYFRFIYAEGEV